MDVDELLDPLLARFWNETRLRAGSGTKAEGAESPKPQMRDSWIAVSEVLALGYGERAGAVITKGRTVMRARTTPSAGALYPFEVLVALRGLTQYEMYEYDVVGCCLRRSGPLEESAVAELLATPPRGAALPEAVVAVVGRPWTSMRKYGRRGYLYTHLDSAHAATSIALAARDAGFRPVAHLRFDRRRTAELFGLTGRCREPQALITLGTPGPGIDASAGGPVNPFAVPIWRHGDSVGAEPPDTAELDAWRSIRSVSTINGQDSTPRRYGSSRCVALSTAGNTGDVVRLAGDGDGDGDGAPVAFRTAALRRRSAKGFLPEAVQGADLGRVLAGLREGMTLDCADGPLAGLRALVRNVGGIEPGSYAYDPEQHALRPLGGGGGLDEQVVEACMNQGVVRGAAVLLVLHAPMGPLLGTRGRQGLAELHFHAAGAAQRLCLAAARHGMGITCLGGFDAGRISELVRLEDSEEVIYILAGGAPDENAVKWDRAPVAYSHGLGPSRQT